MTPPRPAAYRSAFPALDAPEGLTFLDWAATGLLPEATRRAMRIYVDEVACCAGGSSTWLHGAYGEVRNTARQRLGQLLGRPAREVALVESTTAGLNTVARALPIPPSSNVVLSAYDYLAVPTAFVHRSRAEGFALRFVAGEGGVTTARDLMNAVDEHTVAVAVSSLGWTTGARLDLQALGEGLGDSPVFLLVDGVQSFGTEVPDLGAGRIDALAVGGHKWLSSPLGAGFLWMRPEAAERLGPPRAGFLSGRAPRGQWWEWFQDPDAHLEEVVTWPATGRSHEVGGTPSYPGAIGLAESAALLADVGLAAVGAWSAHLRERARAGLEAQGYPVLTPREAGAAAGLLVFRHPAGVEAEVALEERLRKARILVSRRYVRGVGGVRVSCHAANTEADIDRLLEAVGRP